jgi:hypothetical protein
MISINQIVESAIGRNPTLKSLLVNDEFEKFFNKFTSKYNVLAYSILDMSGSFVFFTKEGKIYMDLYSQNDIDHIFLSLLDEESNKHKLLFGGNKVLNYKKDRKDTIPNVDSWQNDIEQPVASFHVNSDIFHVIINEF